MNQFRFFCFLLLILLLHACGNKQELVEVQIPERESFVVPKSKYPEPSLVKTKQGPFEMPGLGFKYDDVPELIKPEALLLHYSKIHLNYANGLNSLVHSNPILNDSIQILVRNLAPTPNSTQDKVGGYFNHIVYWNSITSAKTNSPSPMLEQAIITSFGSRSEFGNLIKKAAKTLEGPGWVWLINTNDSLSIVTTINNELPVSNRSGQIDILLGIDLWEHAYIQTFEDDKNAYLDQVLKHLNWEYANQKYIRKK